MTITMANNYPVPANEANNYPIPAYEPSAGRQREASMERNHSTEDLIAELTEHHRTAAKQEVPWFLANMPDDYFRLVEGRSQRRHLRALTSLRSERITVPEVMLTNDAQTRWTFIASGKGDGTATVYRQISALPDTKSLRRVLLFTSNDERLSLNIYDISSGEAATGDGLPRFVLGAKATDEEQAARDRVTKYAGMLPESSMRNGSAYSSPTKATEQPASPHSPKEGPNSTQSITVSLADGHEKLTMPPSPAKRLGQRERDTFMSRCSSAYVVGQLPRLIHKQMLMYKRVAGTEQVAVDVEEASVGVDWALEEGGVDGTLITVALTGVSPKAALRRMLGLLELYGLELKRAQVDTVDDPSGSPSGDGYVTLLRTLTKPAEGKPPLTSEDWTRLSRDTSRIKWVDDPALRMAVESGGAVSLLQAETMSALADLALSILDHPLLSRKHVHERLRWADVQPHAAKLGCLLLSRFDPAKAMDEAEFTSAIDVAVKEFEVNLTDEESRQLLRAIASAVRYTIRTNAYVEARWALTLRIDPTFFAPVLSTLPGHGKPMSNKPYGVFFCSGRHFSGFHVRFCDIARGGLRLVLPPSDDAHRVESRRHFQECFSLAWAQHLKNKDIPEGGAKAVCLVYPVPGEDRTRLLHGCVKKFVDGLLDLVTFESSASVVNRGAGLGELLYLGPDENITPTDINWIAGRAAVRGYAMPSAFISSKPKAGINHKEFGVTSEGVAVFLEEGLRAIGIDPANQSFSVKITGGPDGDVAGNMIRILNRDYGERVRVVGIADGFGCAEDPDGIPMAELMRLFESSLPIGSLDATKLGPKGVFMLANTPKGSAARNSMHNRVIADAFVPAGGRPSTVNGSNWREFLLEDGTPSARLVVEGANLFFTAEARAALFEHCKLPMIKDSSANKCGVICSSMEIVASMVASEDEFVQIKEKYVPQVLSRLRELARLEAKMLMAERSREPTTALPMISERISFSILRVGQALDAALEKLSGQQQQALWPVVRNQLMPSLFDAPFAAQVGQRLPWPYQKSAISSGLASRLVYREGLAFVEGLPESHVADFAFTYLQEEQRVRALASQVAASGLEFATDVETLLLRGGVRAAAEASVAMGGKAGELHSRIEIA